MKKTIKYLTLFLMVFSFASLAHAQVIADFNSGSAQSNLGGAIEVWLKGNGSDETQTCSMKFVADDAMGASGGQSLQIDYDVDSPNPAYNGVRIELAGFDASALTTLSFYIKGNSATGFSPKFKIELIGSNQRPSPYVFNGVTTEWQKVSVPLSDFWVVNDMSALDKFVIVFADIVNEPKAGSFLIDHIEIS